MPAMTSARRAGLVVEQRLQRSQVGDDVALQRVGPRLDGGDPRDVDHDGACCARCVASLGRRTSPAAQRARGEQQRAQVADRRGDLEDAERRGAGLAGGGSPWLGVGSRTRRRSARGSARGRRARASRWGVGAQELDRSSGCRARSRIVTVGLLVRAAVDRVGPGHAAARSGRAAGRRSASQALTAGSPIARGVGASPAPASPGRRWMPTRWRQRDAGGRRARDVGVGREAAPVLTRGQRRADAVVVALHRLVDALGEREVGQPRR